MVSMILTKGFQLKWWKKKIAQVTGVQQNKSSHSSTAYLYVSLEKACYIRLSYISPKDVVTYHGEICKET